MNDFSLNGASALVVGAGPGIGRSCALALAHDGAAVALAARRAEELVALADEVTGITGAATLAVPTDIGDLAQCRAAVESTIAAFDKIDVVVNVATNGGSSTTVADLDWGDYLAAVQVNVIGTMEICRVAADHMGSAGGGSIINISALSATTLMAGLSRYTSTKGAMESMSKTMAKEVGPAGVRVNIVTPGLTTGAPLDAMFERMATTQDRSGEEISDQFAKQAALRRHVDPDDIAQAVLFLASERSRNITGQTLQVSAGLHIM